MPAISPSGPIELGICDDWSYIKSAQVLAETGHVVYNGWATAMLGWQLYLGALFIKLCGFSFTATRFSTVVEAIATAYLLQRACVRAGLSSWNATLATMAFILSPLCLPLAFTFMSDISGLLCIVACLYMCLRAVQADTERAAMIWISMAALVNAAGGTARQIAWLGVLVMVPSTLWLLRRQWRVVVAGSLSCVIGIGMMVAAMHWFARQPYSLPEPLVPADIGCEAFREAVRIGAHGAGELLLMALPVLLVFVGSFRSWNRRTFAACAAGLFGFALLGIYLVCTGKAQAWLAPFLYDYLTDSTFQRLNALADRAMHLPLANNCLGFLLTGLTVLALLGFLAGFFAGARGSSASQHNFAPIAWRQLGVILGPFCGAYVVLLLPRSIAGSLSDRYLLPLLAVALLVLARFYQDRVQEHLPWACLLLIAVFGGFSVAATHDVFSLYRGYLAATNEMRASGVPATAIGGLWEYEGWTEVHTTGYVNDSRIRIPKGAYVP